MNTAQDEMKYMDILQRVVVPEIFIKIYSNFFDINEEEAEVRMQNTPPDECGSDSENVGECRETRGKSKPKQRVSVANKYLVGSF